MPCYWLGGQMTKPFTECARTGHAAVLCSHPRQSHESSRPKNNNCCSFRLLYIYFKGDIKGGWGQKEKILRGFLNVYLHISDYGLQLQPPGRCQRKGQRQQPGRCQRKCNEPTLPLHSLRFINLFFIFTGSFVSCVLGQRELLVP